MNDISIEKYKDFKIGDSVKRVTGTDVYGNPWDTEGVIVDIRQWVNSKEIYFLVAVNGDKKRQNILKPRQVEKIDKKFPLNKNGQISLFQE